MKAPKINWPVPPDIDSIELQNWFIDKSLDARRAFWGALLTVNGFSLVVFAAQAANDPSRPWLVFAIVACAAIAIVLLLYSFYAVHRDTHEVVKQGYDRQPLSGEQIEAHVKKSANIGRNRTVRESLASGLLIAQIAFIGILVWPRPNVPESVSSPPAELVPMDSTVVVDSAAVVPNSSMVDSTSQ